MVICGPNVILNLGLPVKMPKVCQVYVESTNNIRVILHSTVMDSNMFYKNGKLLPWVCFGDVCPLWVVHLQYRFLLQSIFDHL